MNRFILIVGILCLGCKKEFKNKIGEYDFPHSISLESTEIIKFEAVNGLNNYVSSIQYFQDTTEMVSILNPLTNTFYWFELKTGYFIGSQVFEEDGPNGVGFLGGVSTSYVLNLDSIFLYNIQIGRMFLLDRKSNILERYIVTDYSDPDNLPSPFPSILRPITYNSRKLFLPSGLNNRQSEYRSFPSSLSIDLTTKKVSFPTVFPEIYSEVYWGEMFKYDPAVVPFHDQLILSYPIDFSIHVLDFKTQTLSRFPSPSQYFSEISPFKFNTDYYLSVNQKEKNIEQENHSLSTSDFAGLLADPNGNYLYRIAYLRPDLEDVRQGNKMANFSIIVIDHEFKVVSEKFFDGKIYDNSLIFTSPKGIHLFRKDIYANDEQYLPFEIFYPQPIQ